jgi:hypothetical protein
MRSFLIVQEIRWAGQALFIVLLSHNKGVRSMNIVKPDKKPTEQAFPETASLLHELDLGQHTLFLYEDGSIDLLAHDEQAPVLADNGLSLDSLETYRLFISLREQWQPSSSICSDHAAIRPAME